MEGGRLGDFATHGPFLQPDQSNQQTGGFAECSTGNKGKIPSSVLLGGVPIDGECELILQSTHFLLEIDQNQLLRKLGVNTLSKISTAYIHS
jgi:hypothetical protein